MKGKRMAIAIAIFFFGTLHGIAPSSESQEKKKEQEDWVEEILSIAPPHFLRLIEKGEVTFSKNDNLLKEQGKIALTLFEFDVRHRLQFRVQPDFSAGGRRNYRISMSIPKSDCQLKHQVILPSRFDPRDPTFMKILKHEIDHVAITTDPRIERLMLKILWSPETWVESFAIGDTPGNGEFMKVCEKRIEERRLSIHRLLQSQYDRLDEVSDQGRNSIRDRQAFFDSLFREEELKRVGFEMNEKVRSYVRSPRFQEVGDHYRLLDLP